MNSNHEGQKMKMAVKVSGIKTEDFYNALEVSKGTLYNYYASNELDEDVKSRAAEILGRNVDDIFGKKSKIIDVHNEQNLPQEQVSEDEVIYESSALNMLIRANVDQSKAIKDIAAANVELVSMLKAQTTGNGVAQTPVAAPATIQQIRDTVIDIFLQFGIQTPGQKKVAEHRASVEKSP